MQCAYEAGHSSQKPMKFSYLISRMPKACLFHIAPFYLVNESPAVRSIHVVSSSSINVFAIHLSTNIDECSSLCEVFISAEHERKVA
ncbi:hypothetical protein GDO86_009799 [Hymenochirus boettgeri]|uniref:Uncharacterized protein n=1 Tax=Hymenochirus boettgeri TaxID=247094 RepID=A0A8T2JN66_9PIPI|nr:hypothetical protein GDO86_009799 [Hymenochirus boettgeri]